MRSPEVTVRRATHEDLEMLLRLVLATYAHYYHHRRPLPDHKEIRDRLTQYLNVSPGYEALLALDAQGDPVGYALYARVFWTSECDLALLLKEIFVFEQFRSRGIGALLMRQVAREAEAHGCCRMIWTVDRANSEAMRFYRRFSEVHDQRKTVLAVGGEDIARIARDPVSASAHMRRAATTATLTAKVMATPTTALRASIIRRRNKIN
ncbi:MAG: GNAT family N-acetyltransferase [Alphaproteobacteria bacterium]